MDTLAGAVLKFDSDSWGSISQARQEARRSKKKSHLNSLLALGVGAEITQAWKPLMSTAEPLKLQQVFVLSGPPEHTFVQPVEYTRLLVALNTDGRSIVIEGPSGIGKTTSVVKAIAEAGLTSKVLPLSGRKPADVDFCRCIVVGHARPAHARLDFRCLRFRPVTRAGVLTAAVVVKDQTGLRAPLLHSHVERALGQVQALVIVHRPADDTTIKGDGLPVVRWTAKTGSGSLTPGQPAFALGNGPI